MMTKEQFAKCVVRTFCNEQQLSENQDLSGYITQSSNLAVALEYLDKLDAEGKAYSASRGGTQFVYFDENNTDRKESCSILTTRDILELLPE